MPNFKLDNNIMVYIGIIIVLGLIIILLSTNKGRIVGKIVLKFVLGGLAIYVFNLIGGHFNIGIPLNPLTAAATGFLEIPGFAFILILKYVIYP